jgi:hypothetical protein
LVPGSNPGGPIEKAPPNDHLHESSPRRPPSRCDPELVITSSWLKVFTAWVLVGIGILVEVARQLGFAMIELRQPDHATKAAAKAAKDSAENT